MADAPGHKIVITGTGRAGTTFLVQLLTRLGFDTGYTPETLQRDYFAHCSAGLEHDPEERNAPVIVKNPNLCDRLPAILRRGSIVIDHAIIPVRALEDAANSRIRVGGDGQTPGGLWGTGERQNQKAVLAGKFHELVHTLTVYEVAHTFLLFPRFAQDPDYTRRQLSWLLAGISREDFLVAFRATARPELIHTFAGQSAAADGEPARVFAAVQTKKLRRRRMRRMIGEGVVAALLLAAFVLQHTVRSAQDKGLGQRLWSAHRTQPPNMTH